MVCMLLPKYIIHESAKGYVVTKLFARNRSDIFIDPGFFKSSDLGRSKSNLTAQVPTYHLHESHVGEPLDQTKLGNQVKAREFN